MLTVDVHKAKLLSQLENENEQLKSDLSTKTSELASYREETYATISAMRASAQQTQNMLKRTVLETDELKRNLIIARDEIATLQNSLPFRMLRFYSPRIERLMPDGTRRGELKRVVMRWLGFTPDIDLEESARESSTKEEEPSMKPSAKEESRVQINCETPRLTEESAVKVSESLVVEGWALSEPGMRDVKIYLDDKYMGPVSLGSRRPDVATAFPNVPGAEFPGFSKMLDLRASAMRGQHRLKIVAENNHGSSAAIEGLVEPARSRPIKPAPHNKKEGRMPQKASISVIIPTKIPPPEFGQTLQRIASQDTSTPEVIILNSGSEDLTGIKSKFHVRIIDVNKGSYNHGRVRNYGARIASGDYIVFMSDDAIPANEHLFSDMIRMIDREDLAVVSARQIPRAEADLMASYSICAHYQMLQLDSNRVVQPKTLKGLTAVEKRRLCQVDDVCSCYRRQLFLKHKYSEHVQYAEDLDLGVRLARRGLRLGQLFTNGVVHSHNRAADYFLRRTYVDVKVLSELLGDTSTAETMVRSVQSLDRLLGYCMRLHSSVSASLEAVCELKFCNGNIPLVFQTLKEAVQKNQERSDARFAGDRSLRNVLSQIIEITGCRRSTNADQNPLFESYLTLLGSFENWLSGTRQSLDGVDDQFAEALYKLLGFQIGMSLGQFCRDSSSDASKVVGRLDALLSAGI